MSLRMFVCLSVCSLLRYRLNAFLSPLPEVGCKVFFKDLESLRKSNGKNWSPIWIFFTNKGCKISAQKKFDFGQILQESRGYTTRIRIASLERCFVFRMGIFFLRIGLTIAFDYVFFILLFLLTCLTNFHLFLFTFVFKSYRFGL